MTSALHAVNQQLQQYFSEHPQAGEGLVSVLEEQLSLPQVLALLQGLLADEQALQAVAARSYVHGNGFVKVVLLDEHGHKLRLHIWFAGSACEENIHDHRWSARSTVKFGSMMRRVRRCQSTAMQRPLPRQQRTSKPWERAVCLCSSIANMARAAAM